MTLNLDPLAANDPQAIFSPATGLILSKQELAPNITHYQVYAPAVAHKAQPGQFVILRLSENGERIPLTIVENDPASGSLILIVQEVGKSTALMHRLAVGDVIRDVLGPLGNPSEIKYYGRVAIVSGGVGTAVALPVARALKQAGNFVISIIGARSQNFVILEAEMRAVSDELYITTDDGSRGLHGLVTTQLKNLLDQGTRPDYVLAVGPLPMMQAVAEVTRADQIPTSVSLNTIMVDGTGMCGGCRVTVGGKVHFTCVDGPEFDGHQVDFLSVIQRNKAYDHLEPCHLDARIDQITTDSLKEAALTSREKMRQPMPELPPQIRITNFEEVSLGFNAEQARLEAERCLQCRKPLCVAGCPVSVRIPEFIKLILAGDPAEAGRLIKQDNALPRVCGRVCPQTEQCEGACILNKKGQAVAIGALERFAADFLANQQQHPRVEQNSSPAPRVALVGSGPASLSCAGDLIRSGVGVTVFEAFHEFGGVLRYGIPEFRLPKRIVDDEIQALADLGVSFQANTLIGSTYTVDELLGSEGYQAVFIGTGAGLPNFLNIPGESLVGVYSANEFLTRMNLMKAYQFPRVDTPILDLAGKHVAIIGGGNTALDSARVALRLAARDVSIIYRRTQAEMPGRKEEIAHAAAEGVRFEYLQNPVAFLGNAQGWLTGVRLIRMALGEPDASGRRRPIPQEGSEFDFPADMVVVAIGNGSNPIIQKTTPGLSFNRWGNIAVNPETMQTSKQGVFAGGDIVTGGATVILAMGAGRKAAAAMLNYLKTQEWERAIA